MLDLGLNGEGNGHFLVNSTAMVDISRYIYIFIYVVKANGNYYMENQVESAMETLGL